MRLPLGTWPCHDALQLLQPPQGTTTASDGRRQASHPRRRPATASSLDLVTGPQLPRIRGEGRMFQRRACRAHKKFSLKTQGTTPELSLPPLDSAHALQALAAGVLLQHCTQTRSVCRPTVHSPARHTDSHALGVSDRCWYSQEQRHQHSPCTTDGKAMMKQLGQRCLWQRLAISNSTQCVCVPRNRGAASSTAINQSINPVTPDTPPMITNTLLRPTPLSSPLADGVDEELRDRGRAVLGAPRDAGDVDHADAVL